MCRGKTVTARFAASAEGTTDFTCKEPRLLRDPGSFYVSEFPRSPNAGSPVAENTPSRQLGE